VAALVRDCGKPARVAGVSPTAARASAGIIRARSTAAEEETTTRPVLVAYATKQGSTREVAVFAMGL
jgi:hypothetical protein